MCCVANSLIKLKLMNENSETFVYPRVSFLFRAFIVRSVFSSFALFLSPGLWLGVACPPGACAPPTVGDAKR